MAFTDDPQVPRHFIQAEHTYDKPQNSHRPLCSYLRPHCSHLYAEGRNEARCLADGVRGHSHFLGPDCYSAASSDHTLAACGAKNNNEGGHQPPRVIPVAQAGPLPPFRGMAARDAGAVRGADSGDPGRQVASSSVAAPSLPVRYGGLCGRLGLAR